MSYAVDMNRVVVMSIKISILAKSAPLDNRTLIRCHSHGDHTQDMAETAMDRLCTLLNDHSVIIIVVGHGLDGRCA